jgi:hypothetical protein
MIPPDKHTTPIPYILIDTYISIVFFLVLLFSYPPPVFYIMLAICPPKPTHCSRFISYLWEILGIRGRLKNDPDRDVKSDMRAR